MIILGKYHKVASTYIVPYMDRYPLIRMFYKATVYISILNRIEPPMLIEEYL